LYDEQVHDVERGYFLPLSFSVLLLGGMGLAATVLNKQLDFISEKKSLYIILDKV